MNSWISRTKSSGHCPAQRGDVPSQWQSVEGKGVEEEEEEGEAVVVS